MNYNDFVEAFKNELERRGIQYTSQVADKNGKTLDAICLVYGKAIDGIELCPMLYPELFYEDFGNISNISELLDKIIKEVEKRHSNVMEMAVLMRKFETAAPHLSCKLVSKKRNKEHVVNKRCVYKEFLDLYIIPIVISDLSSVEITKGIAKMWNVSTEEVMNVAMKNLRNEKVIYKNVDDIIGEDCDLPDGAGPMYMLSNSRFIYGASEILIPSILKRIEEEVGGKYWIILSTIHECIIVPLDDHSDPENIKKFIKEFNLTEVKESEYLSDSLYEYTGIPGKEIIIVGSEGGIDGKN